MSTLTFPSTSVPKNIEFIPNSIVSQFQSPFTGQTQTYAFQGGWWSLNLTFPPQLDTQARALAAYLAALQGMKNIMAFKLPTKFLLPSTVNVTVAADGTTVTVNSGTPVVGYFGATSTGRLIQFTSLTSIFSPLPAGTYDINPALSANFRLTSNSVSYSVDEMYAFGFVLPVKEVI